MMLGSVPPEDVAMAILGKVMPPEDVAMAIFGRVMPPEDVATTNFYDQCPEISLVEPKLHLLLTFIYNFK